MKKSTHGGPRTPGPGKRLGRPPAPDEARLIGKTLRMTASEWEQVQEAAQAAELSVNEYIRQRVNKLHHMQWK